MRKTTIIFLMICCAAGARANYDKNLETVLGAARSLEFSREDNRAFLLLKTLTMRSPVALIFGYANNEEACNEIAFDLTRAAQDRALSNVENLYVCDAVY